MKLANVIRVWLPLAAGLTIAFGTIYGVAQQLDRQSINDQLVVLAHDAANDLRSGKAPAEIVGATGPDLTQSLRPMVITYHPDRSVSAFAGSMLQAEVEPPTGTFEAAKAHGETRFTWAPGNQLRLATVLVYADDRHGYALATRSLREVEARASRLLVLVAAGWALALATSLVLTWLISSSAKPGRTK